MSRAKQTLSDERRQIAKLQEDIASLRQRLPDARKASEEAIAERERAIDELKGIRRLRKQALAQRAELKERFSQDEVKERELAKKVADAQAAQKVAHGHGTCCWMTELTTRRCNADLARATCSQEGSYQGVLRHHGEDSAANGDLKHEHHRVAVLLTRGGPFAAPVCWPPHMLTRVAGTIRTNGSA